MRIAALVVAGLTLGPVFGPGVAAQAVEPSEMGRPQSSDTAGREVDRTDEVPEDGAHEAMRERTHEVVRERTHEVVRERTHEIIRLDCRNDLGRREITLFGNGTVRRREGLAGAEVMSLGELPPDRLESLVRRLAAEDLSEVRNLPAGVDGPWVERCELALALSEAPPRRFAFGRYDALPLPLSRLLAVVEDVAAAAVRPERERRLPSGYEPQPGDLLERADGVVFKVMGFTSDGRGVELQGVSQPLTVYIAPEHLRREFVARVERRPW